MTDLPDLTDKLDRVEAFLVSQHEKMDTFVKATNELVAKATNLVKLMDDAEVNHGGLWSGKTMKARDELRLELSKWGGK